MLAPANLVSERPPAISIPQRQTADHFFDLTQLTPLMKITTGNPEVMIGLIDGPVALDHPELTSERARAVPGSISGPCRLSQSRACAHGTFVAGILGARRQSTTPGICPDCTLLVRPIFPEHTSGAEATPSATAEELAAAIVDCIEAGARLVHLSAALAQTPAAKSERALREALDYAMKRGVIVVAAAGNQSAIGSTMITRHPAVIPVIACDSRGRPLGLSNLGNSIGRRGLSAPGKDVLSLGTNGAALPSEGTSVAAPFVTGALALVWSNFPKLSASRIRLAEVQAHASRRAAVVPPLLKAWAIHTAIGGT